MDENIHSGEEAIAPHLTHFTTTSSERLKRVEKKKKIPGNNKPRRSRYKTPNILLQAGHLLGKQGLYDKRGNKSSVRCPRIST